MTGYYVQYLEPEIYAPQGNNGFRFLEAGPPEVNDYQYLPQQGNNGHRAGFFGNLFGNLFKSRGSSSSKSTWGFGRNKVKPLGSFKNKDIFSRGKSSSGSSGSSGLFGSSKSSRWNVPSFLKSFDAVPKKAIHIGPNVQRNPAIQGNFGRPGPNVQRNPAIQGNFGRPGPNVQRNPSIRGK